MAKVRVIDGGIELDENVARLHGLAVVNVDGAHHTDLDGLDDLAAAAGHDLAGGRGDDVDVSEARPGKRNAEEPDDGQRGGSADRGRRRLDDLERGAQELELIAAPAARREHRTRRGN